ncbi:MAG: efflux RND transporter periplasmic adaptor subunit [Chitinophagales bacterium]|nr:efflux RND transporter periplasmic adaptor subunit [Chitinophagales bacterium]
MSKFTWFIVAIVVLVTGIIVYNKVLHPKQNGPARPAGGPPKAMSVNGFVVQPRNLDNNILASGTLLANEEVELHPEVSGKIIQLNLNEGSPVTKGTLLVKLFDADLQAQVKKLISQKETAEKTEQRVKQLLAINGVGQSEYDAAVTTLAGINADIEYTQAQISKTEIRAPFNGIVGLKNVSLGAFVSPTTTIATLQQVDPLKVDFSVPEKYSSALNKGDAIKFTVDGFTQNFVAKVYAIEPRIDESTRTVKVRGLAQNAGAKLFPGAFAKIDLGLKNIQGALMVPTQCIIPAARDKKVIVVHDGKAEFVKVETGLRNESYIQITSGVEQGDTLVATALMYVKPGSDVKVAKVIE